MLLDKLLFDQLNVVGESIIKKADLTSYPKNIEEMERFLKEVKLSIERLDFDGMLIGTILYTFVSSVEIRDRKTTARTFEDIFCALFGLKATDEKSRKNPKPTVELLELDMYNTKEDNFKISSDIIANKREKADVILDNYSISLKTLKGVAYDENGNKMNLKNEHGRNIKNKENSEVNVGSFSYRALLKGILDEDDLAELGDRKKGLGSGKAIRHSVLNKVNQQNKNDLFYQRLDLFMKFVYDDDLYLVLKSHYNIEFILIPSQTFIDCILKTYKYDEKNFEKIWYRWENNNLRMQWRTLLENCDKYHLSYKTINIHLGKAVLSEKIRLFKEEITKSIELEISKMMDK